MVHAKEAERDLVAWVSVCLIWIFITCFLSFIDLVKLLALEQVMEIQEALACVVRDEEERDVQVAEHDTRIAELEEERQCLEGEELPRDVLELRITLEVSRSEAERKREERERERGERGERERREWDERRAMEAQMAELRLSLNTEE